MATANEQIAELVTTITDVTTVLGSATLYVQSVPELIKAAEQAVLANGATPEQVQPLTDLGVALKAKSNDLVAALTANTPTPPVSGRGR